MDCLVDEWTTVKDIWISLCRSMALMYIARIFFGGMGVS